MAAMTQLSANNFRATSERKDHQDGGCECLYLTVYPSGKRSWFYQFRRPKAKGAKQKAKQKIYLGPFDPSGRPPVDDPQKEHPLTHAEARLIANKLTHARKMGRDVVLEARQKQQPAGNTFDACAKDFIEQHVKPKTRNWKETTRMLGFDLELNPVKGGLAQQWAGRPVTSVSDDELRAVIRESRTGIPGLEVKKDEALKSRARKMHSALSKMFSWLTEDEGRIKTNHMLTLKAPETPKKRERVLNKAEIKSFWESAGTLTPPFGDVLKLLLLTGCRREEIAKLGWNEISDDGCSINLPGSRTKNKLPFVLPLSPWARQIIEAQPRVGHYVFTTNGRTPISGWSKMKTRLDQEMKRRLDQAMKDLPPWIIHDLRRTSATYLAEELDVRSEVIEAALNHISGKKAGVAGTYNRAEYKEQKRQALDGWAVYLLNLLG